MNSFALRDKTMCILSNRFIRRENDLGVVLHNFPQWDDDLSIPFK